MSKVVSDVGANRNDKIANAAEVLSRSSDRRKVFLAVYSGGKIKKISRIQIKAGFKNRTRVFQECQKLYSEDIIDKYKVKIDGELAYQKIDFYNRNRDKILSLATSSKKLRAFPTKINSVTSNSSVIRVAFPKDRVNIKSVSIDDIDSFSKVRSVKTISVLNEPVYEKEVKNILKKALGEIGKFTDWGGEKNDLFTTRLVYKGKRYRAAFGLKGKGTKGILTPKKMGKHGDQIQRLFSSPADFFVVQYVGEIDQNIIEQMELFSIAKSVSENRKIFFGIIDGRDTQRLIKAYKS